MIPHKSLGKSAFSCNRQLFLLIRSGKISLAGNKKLKIYGRLNCSRGKRMLISNRVFFTDEDEALTNGYRPCGCCMWHKYKVWKALNVSENIPV